MNTVIHAPAPAMRSRHRWAALAVLALAQFLIVLDASIVNIAIPILGDQLDMGSAALAWVITAYILPFGSLLLLGGRLADRFGHRRVFLLGAGGFVVASAIAGFAVNSGMLLAARAFQGAFAALLAPAALALVTQLFPLAEDRTKALGIWGGVAGIGSAAGVLLGGLLTAMLGWRAVFFINLPIGIFATVAAWMLITRDPARAKTRLDAPGAATITAALVTAVGGLSAAQQLGFGHPLPLGLLAAAVVLGVTFILLERRSTAPLVPLALFRNRNLRVGNLAMLLVGGAMVALFFALSIYLQTVLGYDVLIAGISQLPLAGALVVAAGLAPGLVKRLGADAVLLISLVLLTVGLVWLSAAPSGAGFVLHILGPTVLIGVSLGGAFVTATQLAVDGVEGEESGLAGGLVNTSQQIGGTLGLAVLASLASTRTASLMADGHAEGDALTGGFSWLFLGAAVLVVAAGIVVAATPRRRAATR